MGGSVTLPENVSTRRTLDHEIESICVSECLAVKITEASYRFNQSYDN